MSKYSDKTFWTDTADRAVSTFAQGTLGAILASSVTNVVELDLAQSAGVGALAALVSVLQSVAARGGEGKTTPGSAVYVNTPRTITAEEMQALEGDREFENPDSPQFDTETR